MNFIKVDGGITYVNVDSIVKISKIDGTYYLEDSNRNEHIINRAEFQKLIGGKKNGSK